jgi:hypothetical protein
MTDATTNETPNIDKQVEENGELLAVAASERLARRQAAREAQKSLRPAQLLIRRAAGRPV